MLADDAPGPDALAEQSDMIAHVRRILDQELTPKQREALILLGIQDVPLEEAAERMKTNRNALYKLLHDARLRLKRRLKAEGLSAQRCARRLRKESMIADAASKIAPATYVRELSIDMNKRFREALWTGAHELPDEVVQGFLRVLEQVRLEDMPCSQVFALLDQYVEKEVGGEAAERLMPLLREHLDICPNCCEEYEALLRALERVLKSRARGASDH